MANTAYHYVYMLRSLALPDRFYVGLTQDLAERLKRHNTNRIPSIAPLSGKLVGTYDSAGRR